MAVPTLYRIGGALVVDATTRALIAVASAPDGGPATGQALTLDDGPPLTDETGAAMTLD